MAWFSTERCGASSATLGYGLDMCYVVEPGAFKVWIGPNSTEGLEGEFEVQ